jgi:hypothetical protein
MKTISEQIADRKREEALSKTASRLKLLCLSVATVTVIVFTWIVIT